ncbi:hypothetical protein LX32DRAFT_381679 [Colletotrichum zoysiae]|uniref:Uncharacterized protein n=1 Tax=Colletotrichum zoysiae TaxID=1216348 RepID=A0AAD9HGY7_9PEZI|nr:hypothetical protein LX32DRAFT_381679 [Colletotrichum zoysiae]
MSLRGAFRLLQSLLMPRMPALGPGSTAYLPIPLIGNPMYHFQTGTQFAAAKDGDCTTVTRASDKRARGRGRGRATGYRSPRNPALRPIFGVAMPRRLLQRSFTSRIRAQKLSRNERRDEAWKV